MKTSKNFPEHRAAGILMRAGARPTRDTLDNLGFNSLKVKSVNKIYQDSIKKSEERKKAKTQNESSSSKKERILKLAKNWPAFSAAEYLPYSGYNLGESKYIFLNDICISKISNEGYYTGRYAYRYNKNIKYGYVALTLKSLQELKSLRVVGGVITLKDRQLNKDLWYGRAVYSVGEKQHFHLEIGNTYVIERLQYHFEAKNDSDARKIAGEKIAREKRLKKEFLQRKKIRENEEKQKARIAKIASRIPNNHVFVGINDSYRAGNCVVGTLNFCNRGDLNDQYAYRGDLVRTIAERLHTERFASKAIEAAKLRLIENQLVAG